MMKARLLIIPLLALSVSCSSNSGSKSTVEQAAETSSAPKEMSAASAQTQEEAEQITGTDTAAATEAPLPEAYSKYNLNLLDTAIAASGADTLSATASEDTEIADSNKYKMAYETGMSFASKPPTNLFADLVLKAEQQGDASSAAIMMAGKYFKLLEIFASEQFDEKKLKQGIDGLENLKKYVNDAMQSTKDISTNIILQKIVENTTQCRAIYEKCNEEYSGQTDKYQQLTTAIKDFQQNLVTE